MEGRKNGKVGKDKQGGKGEGKWGWEGSGPPHLSERGFAYGIQFNMQNGIKR